MGLRSNTLTAPMFCIIDLSAIHAVVGVVSGVAKGIHGLTPSRTVQGVSFPRTGDHSLRLFEDLLNRCQAKIPLKRLVAVVTTQNARARRFDADLHRSMRSGVQSRCGRDDHN